MLVLHQPSRAPAQHSPYRLRRIVTDSRFRYGSNNVRKSSSVAVLLIPPTNNLNSPKAPPLPPAAGHEHKREARHRMERQPTDIDQQAKGPFACAAAIASTSTLTMQKERVVRLTKRRREITQYTQCGSGRVAVRHTWPATQKRFANAAFVSAHAQHLHQRHTLFADQRNITAWHDKETVHNTRHPQG